MTPAEARDWADQRRLVPTQIEGADGRWHDCFAVPDIETRLAAIPALPARMRIINPFDPAIRDRQRLQRLFGFEYRNEMFVPPADRRWGYYVYPLLEADRFVGRIELKADRREGLMRVTGFWPEAGVGWTGARTDRLHAELQRFARLAGLALDKDSLPSGDQAYRRDAGSQAVSP